MSSAASMPGARGLLLPTTPATVDVTFVPTSFCVPLRQRERETHTDSGENVSEGTIYK
jgi:hypothetical protein